MRVIFSLAPTVPKCSGAPFTVVGRGCLHGEIDLHVPAVPEAEAARRDALPVHVTIWALAFSTHRAPFAALSAVIFQPCGGVQAKLFKYPIPLVLRTSTW